MKQTKRAWFMPFRLPRTTDFEAWLEREAAEGYTPSKVGQLSSFCMTLVKGEPTQYRYYLDMQLSHDAHYRAAHEEFGWEYVGAMASSKLWRKQYKKGESRTEALTDDASTKDRNTRFLSSMIIPAVIFLLVATLLAVGSVVTGGHEMALIILAVLFAFVGFGLVLLGRWTQR